MQINPKHSTWLDIDLGAIQRNTTRLRDRCRAEVMAVVKAGGYGHGAAPAVHVKGDSGMKRIGRLPNDAVEFVRQATETAGVTCQGVYTHFACADAADRRPTEKQQAAFSGVVGGLQAARVRPGWG